jgi:hypothetical protein
LICNKEELKMSKNNITGLSDSGKNMLPTKRAAATGMPKTLAPTIPPLREKDAPIGYGANHDGSASSDLPGHRTVSPLGRVIETFNDDKILAAIIGHNPQRGGHYAVDGTDDWQTRLISKSPIRHASNMKDPNKGGSPSGKVASGLVANEQQPVRKPGA